MCRRHGSGGGKSGWQLKSQPGFLTGHTQTQATAAQITAVLSQWHTSRRCRSLEEREANRGFKLDISPHASTYPWAQRPNRQTHQSLIWLQSVNIRTLVGMVGRGSLLYHRVKKEPTAALQYATAPQHPSSLMICQRCFKNPSQSTKPPNVWTWK